MNKRIISCLVVAMLSASLQAQVYTWVDENGKTHYSDKKPDGAAKDKVEQVDESALDNPNVVDSSVSNVDVDRMTRDRKRREQEDATKAKRQITQAAQEWKNANCSEQMENIRQGKAGGGTRIVGTKQVKRCNQAIPSEFKPYLSGYIVE